MTNRERAREHRTFTRRFQLRTRRIGFVNARGEKNQTQIIAGHRGSSREHVHYIARPSVPKAVHHIHSEYTARAQTHRAHPQGAYIQISIRDCPLLNTSCHRAKRYIPSARFASTWTTCFSSRSLFLSPKSLYYIYCG